eukprot:48500_1
MNCIWFMTRAKSEGKEAMKGFDWRSKAFLLTNYGFQTWEYSPLYALRSYAYLLPQYGIGHVLLSSFSLSTQPFIIFYALRIILSIICVLCEFYFASSLTPWFGPQTSFFTFIFLALSSGMFNCCAAYLPQQFVLCMLLLSFGCFFRQYRVCAIWFMGCAAIIGWPFIALLAVPLAIDCIMFYGMIGFIASNHCGRLIVFIRSRKIVFCETNHQSKCETDFTWKQTI